MSVCLGASARVPVSGCCCQCLVAAARVPVSGLSLLSVSVCSTINVCVHVCVGTSVCVHMSAAVSVRETHLDGNSSARHA